jgi:hypothetical protein
MHSNKGMFGLIWKDRKDVRFLSTISTHVAHCLRKIKATNTVAYHEAVVPQVATHHFLVRVR